MSESFAARIRRLREAQGLSMVTLALAAGCSEGTIRALEAGQVKAPNFLLGLRLADVLHVDPYYLAMGEGASVTERFIALERRIAALEKRPR